MNIVTEINHWLLLREQLNGKTIGFVPTMGNLHAGHISLCQRAKAENEIVVVSIFINPTQFNESKDFEKYPRTLDQDIELLTAIGVDYLFVPQVSDLYPDNYEIKIIETSLSQMHEGEFRPGHFDGMLTVVMKLLNLIRAKRAYFGEKDYQQLLLVKKMVTALFINTEIIAGETIRAEDGLALSSRNSRLTVEQRQQAAHLPRLLQSHLSLEEIQAELHHLGFKVEYVVEDWQRRLAAVWLGEIRLIDNIAWNKE